MENTDISILKNVVINNKLNISIPYNSSANSPFLVFQSNPKQYPMLIHSISLNYDISNTATNYVFYVEIDGITIDNNNYQQLSLNAQVFDFVPTGKAFKVPAGSLITIHAYNNGGATANGSISISIVEEIIN